MGDVSVLATYLVMLFTDGKIFVGDVSRRLQLPAHLAFHTSWVEVRLVHLALGHWAIIRLKVSSQIHQDCVVVVGPVYLNQHKICGLSRLSPTSPKNNLHTNEYAS